MRSAPAGDNRHAGRFRCLDDVRDDTGRDDELGAGADGTARTFGIDHRSRADEDALSTSTPRQLADDVDRIRDRECDLGDRQPRLDEYFSNADGDIGAVGAYDGYHADLEEDGERLCGRARRSGHRGTNVVPRSHVCKTSSKLAREKSPGVPCLSAASAVP